jgi:hypothetical protein
MSSCSTLQYKYTECINWYLLALCLRKPADRIRWVISEVNSLPIITDSPTDQPTPMNSLPVITDRPTNSKEHTPSSESNSSPVNQEIPLFYGTKRSITIFIYFIYIF